MLLSNHITLLAIIGTVHIASGTFFTSDEEDKNGGGVFGKIKSGLQLAGEMLGLDQASSIAELVAKTFGKVARKSDEERRPQSSSIISGFLRLLGLDTAKIGAIAVNAIIFLAQLISKSFSLPKRYLAEVKQTKQQRSLKPGSPLEWILENPTEGIANVLELAKDKNLPDKVVDMVKRHTKEDGDCVQLLVCKSSPFIWGMQKALNDYTTNRTKKESNKTVKSVTRIGALFQYLPNVREFEENGHMCEEKHESCKLF